MKIAIPSQDKIHVFDHFGRTPGFTMVESDKNVIIKKEYKVNDFTGHARNEHLENKDDHVHQSHGSIFAALNDVDVVIARGMGRRLLHDFQAKKIEVFITLESSVDLALKQFFSGTLDHNPDVACDH